MRELRPLVKERDEALLSVLNREQQAQFINSGKLLKIMFCFIAIREHIKERKFYRFLIQSEQKSHHLRLRNG